MLQARYSKLKQVFVSVFVPRLLLKDSKIYNSAVTALQHISKARKSTHSSNNEEQMRIIDKCFGKSDNEHITDIQKTNDIEKLHNIEECNIITPEVYNISHPKQHATMISKLFGTKPSQNFGNQIEDANIKSTTAKIEEEKLAQKIEIIDETPHVEAHAPKVEGLNLPPKVLHNDSYILELSKKREDNEQIKLDELAKRCLGSPIQDIDKILIQELKNMNRKNPHSSPDSLNLVRTQITDNSNNLSNIQNQTFYGIDTINTDYKFDKIQPIHLETKPLLKDDEGNKEYKDGIIVREFSTIYFTTDVDDNISNTPAPLSPYEKPAIPFYEYINKDITASEGENEIETAANTEQIQESDIIFHDERHQSDPIDERDGHVGEIETEQPFDPKPNISQFSETIRKHNTMDVNDSLYQKSNENYFPNVFAFQRYFTSSPDQTSGWFPEDTPQKSERHNTAISATLTPSGDSKNLEIPSDTAISANQNPDEYYKISFSEEIITENKANVLKIFAESPVTQNVIFSALPQQMRLEENAVEKSPIDSKINNDPISNILFEPKPEEDRTNDTAMQHLTELAKENDKKHTESIPLSLLLKRIREQNRLEYCRNIISQANVKLEGPRKCPPIEKKKIKTTKNPCPSKPKTSCDQIKPCQPQTKKDPCAKLTPLFFPIFKLNCLVKNVLEKPNGEAITYLSFITEDIIQRLNKLGQKLRYISTGSNENDEVIYARDFDPWIPIPSWPLPKKEKAKTFVCPKEGCKIPLPKSNKQPYKGKQCVEAPKTNYSVNQVLSFDFYNVDYSRHM